MNSESGVVGGPPVFGSLAPPQLLRERVYEAIEASIVSGALRPGHHLREDELARQLGVSRNPVREALQRLMHEGLVDHRQGRGTFVHTPTPTEVAEVFVVRALLESECARLAAQNATAESLATLADLLERGAHGVAQQEPELLLQLNEEFHGVLLDLADNTLMSSMMVSLRRRIRWYFAGVVVQQSSRSWDQHRALYEAIEDGDGDAAARIMKEHVAHTGSAIREQMTPTE